MEVLVILLLISHFTVLFFIWRYIQTYKKNNLVYLNNELQTLREFFGRGLLVLEKEVTAFTNQSVSCFDELQHEQNQLIHNHKSKFEEITSFIKKDYKSLTKKLEKNNVLLISLLQRTEKNITKNDELKPLLINSHEELEKVYGKIKLLISNYEKNLKDIKEEIEETLATIKDTTNSKIKQLSTSGEKILGNAIQHSKTSIEEVTQETNKGLKKVLKENQIQLLTDKVVDVEKELKDTLLKIQKSIAEIDLSLIQKFDDYEKKLENKKGFLGF